MQTAGFPQFIETLFFIVVFYYALKFVAQLLLPVVVKKVVQKAEERFHEQYGQPSPKSRPEHQQAPPKSDRPRSTKIVGEYVDYEEIE